VLHRIGALRKPVAKQVLEHQLAEPAARLGGTQRVFEPAEVLHTLEHLGGRLVRLAKPLVDLVRGLRRSLEPAVDLRVELGKSPVHRLGHAPEAPVDLAASLGELDGGVAAQRAELGAQDAHEPDQRGGQPERESNDEGDGCHPGRQTVEIGPDGALKPA